MTTTCRRTSEERLNTLTHLAGVALTVPAVWFVLSLSARLGAAAFAGSVCFAAGAVLMFVSSAAYHWCMPGALKRALRVADHVSIYVMIAGSYAPVCIYAVGGAAGWTVFALLCAVVVCGTVYKVAAMGRWPRVSLALYLMMGWSGLLIARQVCARLPAEALVCILAEGLFYTAGAYFFAHDDRRFFHAVWHVFVLLGAASHWLAMVFMLRC